MKMRIMKLKALAIGLTIALTGAAPSPAQTADVVKT